MTFCWPSALIFSCSTSPQVVEYSWEILEEECRKKSLRYCTIIGVLPIWNPSSLTLLPHHTVLCIPATHVHYCTVLYSLYTKLQTQCVWTCVWTSDSEVQHTGLGHLTEQHAGQWLVTHLRNSHWWQSYMLSTCWSSNSFCDPHVSHKLTHVGSVFHKLPLARQVTSYLTQHPATGTSCISKSSLCRRLDAM